MSVVGGQEFPRPMTEAEMADARIVQRHLPGVHPYKPGEGIFHWSTGPYWPQAMRKLARDFERAVPVLRRMADWLDARQPREESKL